MRGPLIVLFFFVASIVRISFGFNVEAAVDQWSRAYSWLQTGRNLTASGCEDLALASYREALVQFEKVASDFPDYETQLVNYRLERLKEEIGAVTSRLSPESVAVADDYLAFIHLLDRVDELRYQAQRDEALVALQQARAALEAIVEKNPDSYGPAVASQTSSIAEQIGMLEASAARKRVKAPVVARSTSSYTPRGRGTTEYVQLEDLPSTPSAISGVLLFP